MDPVRARPQQCAAQGGVVAKCRDRCIAGRDQIKNEIVSWVSGCPSIQCLNVHVPFSVTEAVDHILSHMDGAEYS